MIVIFLKDSICYIKKMPGQMCVVGGCSNRSCEETSLHRYPKDTSLWPSWNRFVVSMRKNFSKGNAHTVVCSSHFKEDSFTNVPEFRMKFAKKLLLKTGAIPTIKPAISVQTETTPAVPISVNDSDATTTRKRKRSSILLMKLKLAREAQVDEQALLPPAHASAVSMSDEKIVMSDEGVLETNITDKIQLPESSCLYAEQNHIGIQAKVRYRSKKVLAKPLLAEVGIQHNHSSASCADMAVQCNRIGAPPLELFSPTIISKQQDESAHLIESPQTTCTDQAECLNHPKPQQAAHIEDKYIVFQHNLLELFDTCPKCTEPATAQITETIGTCIRIRHTCTNKDCGFSRVWASQPFKQNMPLGNLVLSSAILFSGSLPMKALRVLQLCNIKVFNVSTFYRHQREYLFPIVELEWEKEQEEIIAKLNEDGKPLVLIGDGRSDSPGHCAKYGSYTVIEQRINKVIDIQVIQSNEVKNSTWCELEGLKRTLAVLSERNLTVNTLVTDRHPQIKKYLRENHGSVQHFFDIWHVAKGVWKKIDKLSLADRCEDVGLWKRSIRNHLYWAAVSTPNNCGETKKAKWMSLLYHIQNIHSDLPSHHFPACDHGQLKEEEARQWLEPTTKAYTSLEKIVADKRLLNDVARLSSGEQTSHLEAFHSLLLHFAPKHTAFSWLGMRTRHKLAAMHYNENGNRSQATNKVGEPKFQVYYAKAQKFEARVRPVSTAHTYSYAVKLQGILLQRYSKGPGSLRKSIDHIKAARPGFLTEKADRVPRHEAVANHMKRFCCRQTTSVHDNDLSCVDVSDLSE